MRWQRRVRVEDQYVCAEAVRCHRPRDMCRRPLVHVGRVPLQVPREPMPEQGTVRVQGHVVHVAAAGRGHGDGAQVRGTPLWRDDGGHVRDRDPPRLRLPVVPQRQPRAVQHPGVLLRQRGSLRRGQELRVVAVAEQVPARVVPQRHAGLVRGVRGRGQRCPEVRDVRLPLRACPVQVVHDDGAVREQQGLHRGRQRREQVQAEVRRQVHDEVELHRRRALRLGHEQQRVRRGLRPDQGQRGHVQRRRAVLLEHQGQQVLRAVHPARRDDVQERRHEHPLHVEHARDTVEVQVAVWGVRPLPAERRVRPGHRVLRPREQQGHVFDGVRSARPRPGGVHYEQ
eukprot:PhM_4_TR14616/c4_g1_i1/m.84438